MQDEANAIENAQRTRSVREHFEIEFNEVMRPPVSTY
jgi:hypothetical protein